MRKPTDSAGAKGVNNEMTIEISVAVAVEEQWHDSSTVRVSIN